MRQFVVHYGLPERIISDQGQNFESDLISELFKLAKIWKLHTTHTIHRQMDSVKGLIVH